MNLLADESVDAQIVERLRAGGHTVTYVAEMGPGITDDEVLDRANAEACPLVTADKSFGERVYRLHRVTHGVILIHLPGIRLPRKVAIVSEAMRWHGEDMQQAFTTIRCKQRSPFAILGLVLPPVGIVASAIVAIWLIDENDWLGMRMLAQFLVGLALCSVVAIVLPIASFLRKEPRRMLTLCWALPGASYLLLFTALVLDGLSVERNYQRQRQLIGRLAGDECYRSEFVDSGRLTHRQVRALLSDQVRDLLTEDQVRTIWELRKDVDTGMYYSALVKPLNTPIDVLREYFDRELDQAKRRGESDARIGAMEREQMRALDDHLRRRREQAPEEDSLRAEERREDLESGHR